MKVLVTGAGGFLGQRLVAALLRDGHAVRALVRPDSPFDPRGCSSAVEVFRADLSTTEDLAPAFEGVDVLVHLAAGGDWGRAAHVCRFGQRNGAIACFDGGIRLPQDRVGKHICGIRLERHQICSG